MWVRDLWELLERNLFTIPSGNGLFNQYRDTIPALDLPEGATLRRHNLRHYLESFEGPPIFLLVGEAAGYRGGRFSGVPFTSERQLLTPGFLPFTGQPTSIAGPYSEISATVVWGELRRTQARALHWNCVPLHAHKPGVPLSNRTPIPREVRRFCALLAAICDIVKTRQVVALGRQAQAALAFLGVPHAYVRHPASGGAAAFRRGFRALLEGSAACQQAWQTGTTANRLP